MKTRHKIPAAAVAVMLALGAAAPARAADTIAGVQSRIQACDRQASTAAQHHACVYKATPRKCRSYVSGEHGKFYTTLVQQQWFTCLRSCDGASLLSRMRGECSTLAAQPAGGTGH
jgi:hypothetical protein